MNNVALPVDHDVPVMTILDLQDVASEGIRSHGLNEVQAGLLKCDGVLAAVSGDEEVEQVVYFSTTHLITRSGVGDDIDDATLHQDISPKEV